VRIEVRGLRKSFGSNEVLRGVDLTLEERGVTIILGGSGAGKSVLLKHIVGLLHPDSGSILVDGVDIARLGERQLQPYRARMAYIFQAGGLIHSLSVGANVGLALSERRQMSRRQVERVVAEKLEQVGLAGKEKESPSNLSGGMMKRVAIARALASAPELLLYDEPTAGLDPPTAASIDELIGMVATDLGVTSAVVTHDMLTVFSIGTQVNFLHQGQLAVSDTPEGFRASDHPQAKEFLERESRSRGALILGADSSAAGAGSGADGERAAGDPPRRRWRGAAVEDTKPNPRASLKGQATGPTPTHPPLTIDEEDDVDVPPMGQEPAAAAPPESSRPRRWRGAMDDTKPSPAPHRGGTASPSGAQGATEAEPAAEGTAEEGTESGRARRWRGGPVEDTKPTPKGGPSPTSATQPFPSYQPPAAPSTKQKSAFDETKPPWERAANRPAPSKQSEAGAENDATKPPWER
jgi:phospholipid/cholesterol/gamma-HCH transport system ATP-binding protein